jgi:hypothetical protein
MIAAALITGILVGVMAVIRFRPGGGGLPPPGRHDSRFSVASRSPPRRPTQAALRRHGVR